MPELPELALQVERLSQELDRRGNRHRKVEPYFQPRPGRLVVPPAVVKADLANAYRLLMGMAEVPWGKTIVNSKLDRLEVLGIDSGDQATDDRLWAFWQDNAMDLESKLAHSSALLDGRAHALVWPDADGVVRVTLDDVTQMVVQYRDGSRRDRVAALRRWVDENDQVHATLYRRDGIWKFRRPSNRERSTTGDRATWVPRDVPDETWPMENPLDVVPVVELAVNRRLAPGCFAHARGEYEDVTGLMDRINLLTFLGLVVALYQGFPLRGVIGDKILRDDKGKALPPFDANADSVFQFENPDAKIAEFKAAERGNLSVFSELTELAASTSTPRHYLPMDGGISNVSEPTIRAFEGGMHATVNASHKPSLGEGWEEVLRLAGRMLDEPVALRAGASLKWADHESRSLGERADAYQKLAGGGTGLPWQAAAELALNASPAQLTSWEAGAAGSALGDLVRAASTPAGAAA